MSNQIVGFDITMNYPVLPAKELQDKLGEGAKELVLHIAYRPTNLVTYKGKPLSDAALDSLVEGSDKGLSGIYKQKPGSAESKVKPSKDPYVVNEVSAIEKPGKKSKADPTSAIIYTLDRSGSMGGVKLERAKESIVSSLEKIASEKPDALIGLVTYDHAISIHNLNNGSVKSVDGDISSLDELKKAFSGTEYSLAKASEVVKQIKNIMGNIHSGGTTALGPSMALSALLLGDNAGTVTLATDGLANVGLGSVERCAHGSESDEMKNMRAVYNEIAQMFVENGKVCNVVGILDGAETEAAGSNRSNKLCLDIISIPAYATSGSLALVDPTTGQGVFNDIMKKTLDTYATNVQIEIEHKGLKFKKVIHGNAKEEQNKTIIKAPAVIGSEGFTDIVFDISDIKKSQDLGIKITYQTPGGQAIEMKPGIVNFETTKDEQKFKDNINKAVITTHFMSEVQDEIFRKGYGNAKHLALASVKSFRSMGMDEEELIASEVSCLAEEAEELGGAGDRGSEALFCMSKGLDELDSEEVKKRVRSLRNLVEGKDE